MATVTAKYDDTNIDKLIKQFRKEVEREEILNVLKNRREFKKPSRIKYERRVKVEYRIRKKAKRDENKSRHKSKARIRRKPS